MCMVKVRIYMYICMVEEDMHTHYKSKHNVCGILLASGEGGPGLPRTFLGFLVLLLWDPSFLKIFPTPSPSPSLSQESPWQSWTYIQVE